MITAPGPLPGAVKILLAVSRYPWPPRRGDQLRTLQMIDFLAGEHELTVLAPEPEASAPPPPRPLGCTLVTYRRGGRRNLGRGLLLAARHGLPLQSGIFYEPDLQRLIGELAPRHDLGVLQLVRLAVHVDDFGATPLVVDLIDSLSLNFARRAQVDRWWLRLPLRIEARLLSHWEHRLLGRSVAGLVVCERDRLALSRRRLLAPRAAARLTVVPLAAGVRDDGPPSPRASTAAPVLALTGNLGYFVNDDAARWFLARVWPELRSAMPRLRLVIAGDRPSRGLRQRIAAAGAELVESPPDLRALLAGAALALAPMRCGSGMPLKVLEAWSVGVPVVASHWAAAGTSGAPGEDLVIADSPREWAHAILDLLEDEPRRRRIATAALARLRTSYSRDVVRRELLATLGRLDANRTASVAATVAAPA